MRLREVGGTQEDGVWVWAERSRLAVQGEGRGRGSAASIGGELTEEMSVRREEEQRWWMDGRSRRRQVLGSVSGQWRVGVGALGCSASAGQE